MYSSTATACCIARRRGAAANGDGNPITDNPYPSFDESMNSEGRPFSHGLSPWCRDAPSLEFRLERGQQVATSTRPPAAAGYAQKG